MRGQSRVSLRFGLDFRGDLHPAGLMLEILAQGIILSGAGLLGKALLSVGERDEGAVRGQGFFSVAQSSLCKSLDIQGGFQSESFGFLYGKHLSLKGVYRLEGMPC